MAKRKEKITDTNEVPLEKNVNAITTNKVNATDTNKSIAKATKDTKDKKKKKKKTCCQKYGPKACCIRLRNCFCRWLCRRIRICCRRCCKRCFGKCIREEMFRLPSIHRPSIHPREYQIAGMNIDDMVDKLKFQKSDNKMTLSPSEEKFREEYGLVKGVVTPVKRGQSMKRNSFDVLSKIKSNPTLKKQFLQSINVDELKERLKLPGSKTALVKEFLQDHAKEFSRAIQDTIESARHVNRKVDIDKLNKEQKVYMLHEYVRSPKNNRFWSQRTTSRRRWRYRYPSITTSSNIARQKQIKRVIRDYSSGKFSRVGLPKNAKLTKSQFEILLDEYEYRKNRFPFLSLSKIKWFPMK